jgi:hypothetical protein
MYVTPYFQTPDAQSLALVATVDLNAYGKANNKNPEHWIQVCAMWWVR